MQITENKLVTVQYELFVKNSNGSFELMEATTPEAPLKYMHGVGMMLPKFEEQLTGKSVGDKFEFLLAASDAYGERSDDNVIDLPLDVFTSDGTLDEERFFPGAIVPLVDTNGDRINAEIVKIATEAVTVDLNHPLAGEDLLFKVKVLDVHTPTDDELASLHSSCGGDCSGCGDDHHHHDGGCGGGCCGCH